VVIGSLDRSCEHRAERQMFSMIMLMWTHKGESFTLADYTQWFVDAGLSAPEVHPSQGMPSAWLVGGKR
jgi:hypothetical protein